MKELQLYVDTCINELNAIGIYPHRISKWTVNYRAKSRWGRCSINKGIYTIQIACCLLADSAPDKGLKETIIHELLHAVSGCMNHGDKWTALANQVNNTYGYSVKRSDSYADKGFTADPMPIEHNYKYKITCTSCSHEWKYQRMSKAVKYCKKNIAVCPYCNKSAFMVIDI